MAELTELNAGMPVIYGGNKVTTVPQELADVFAPGDHLVVVQGTGDLLHIPKLVWDVASGAVTRAADAFAALGSVSDDSITQFFDRFADLLADDETFAPIAAANREDIVAAKARGRSTTRLELSSVMRSDMIAGLRSWALQPSGRNAVVDQIDHAGWSIQQIRAGLGVVGFVFEGRPNVFADACGVLRSGNTVVFRIGSDALGTARAIVEHGLDPALAQSGLPRGAATLVDSAERSAGHAMFSDPRLSLAVARGSGGAVAQLGAVARQAGIAVSLHGSGGAWMVVSETADADRFAAVVENSLDRKVCNTLNTCCIVRSVADTFVPRFLTALEQAGTNRGAISKLHIVDEQADTVPDSWFEDVQVNRAEGLVNEPRTSLLGWNDLGIEWEWEDSPEVTLVVVDSVAEAIELFNRLAPRFTVSLLAGDPVEHDEFFARVDAPFVGDGFTRWVDGQYALNRPELGLSNWEFGRLFGRAGVLSGDSVFTIRSRVRQDDDHLRR
jgi:glutamate-5-semialdehyde dehydrogenase